MSPYQKTFCLRKQVHNGNQKKQNSIELKQIFPVNRYDSLHDRRFMSQAKRTRYFARSATRARSARRRGEKFSLRRGKRGEISPSSRASRSCRAPREISHSPHLAHKAPVMQATAMKEMKRFYFSMLPTRGLSEITRVLLCRTRTYELPTTSSDAVPLNEGRLVLHFFFFYESRIIAIIAQW